MTLTTVGLLATEPVSLFEFSVVAEIFGIDRTDDGCPPFEFRVCAADPSRPLATKTTAPGLTITATHDLTGLAGCDLVVLGASPIEPDGSPIRPVPAEITDALLACADAGATLLSVCTGAFLLASTGLLDGRTCATHWMYADELGRRHPHVIVDADSLYVDEGRLITSAGTAAGIEACLHLVRRELGTAVATRIARRMVVPPHRDGGQQQYVDRPVPTPSGDSLAGLVDWLSDHLNEPHTAASLARRAMMSERTFARRFLAEVGTTPHQWLVRQRVLAARELLEQSDLAVEQVAARVGFASAVVLRDHFRRQVGVAPSTYRSRFAAVG